MNKKTILMSLITKLYSKIKRIFFIQKTDIDLIKTMSNNFKEPEFYFLLIGAHDGKSFDDLTYNYIRSRENLVGFAIEPVKKYYEELCHNFNNHPNFKCLNIAIHSDKKKVILYKVKEDRLHKYEPWAKGINSLFYEHHKKTKIASEDIEECLIKADTLDNILKMENVNYPFNLVQIDTEGYDFEILKMINFEKYPPDIIKYEHINLSTKDQQGAINLLERNRYKVLIQNNDSIALKSYINIFYE